MNSRLNFWKNDNDSILVDADNIFWMIAALHGTRDAIIPAKAISLYEKIKDRLDSEMHDFRFGQELTAVYIDPTDKCNARCSYCYIPAKVRQSGHSMTADELDLILRKIKRYFNGKKRKPVIIFHASEPLLVKDIIFDAIRKYSTIFKFGLQTNGILLEEKDIAFLKKYMVGVGISLDSFSSSVNDSLRPGVKQGGNFEKAVRAIKWFDGYAGLSVITTVTKFNVKDLPGIVSFLHARKVPCVLLNPMRFTQASIGALKPDEKILTRYFIKAVDRAMELTRRSGRQIIVGNFANVLLGIVAPASRRLMCDISPCGGGRCFFTITASGEMIPCGEFIGLQKFSGGNIFKTGIEQAMGSKPFKSVRERTVEKIDKCKPCLFRNICGAPCAAELHSLGNMYQPSVFCEFYKVTIKHAFKLIAEGKEKYLLREEGAKALRYDYKL